MSKTTTIKTKTKSKPRPLVWAVATTTRATDESYLLPGGRISPFVALKGHVEHAVVGKIGGDFDEKTMSPRAKARVVLSQVFDDGKHVVLWTRSISDLKASGELITLHHATLKKAREYGPNANIVIRTYSVNVAVQPVDECDVPPTLINAYKMKAGMDI